MNNLRKEAVDQSAHFALAALAVGSLSVLGADLSLLTGAVLGLMLGVVREYTEDQFKGAGWRTAMDIAFWTLGGAVAGAL